LFGWHAALFRTGYSGLSRIKVGGWRDDAADPMQVVSGSLGRQRVHFEAPPADRLESEIDRFLAWANRASNEPPLKRSRSTRGNGTEFAAASNTPIAG
jgi:Fic family protein